MLDFVAIDFETANRSRNSAISLAAVTVEDGKIVKKAYSLIKPPFMNFEEDLIEIHGIKPEEVLDKPTFEQLWPAIYENHLKGKTVIAHNAKFDIEVLQATLKHYDLNWPDFKYACTVKISRKAWPMLQNHKLNTVGGYLGIQFHHHHALDDAVTCAQVAIAAARDKNAQSLDELMQILKLNYENFIADEKQVQTSFF